MLSKSALDEALLKAHKLHLGLYRRVADKLGVNASQVSRVAGGTRRDLKIRLAIVDELRKIQRGLK
jgi:transcriptional regulator with XRE-family HTH domain